jgi:hypothetical protein
MNNFCYNHIFKIHNFQSQFSTFEPNVLKWVLKKQFKRNGEHLVKKGHLKKTRTIDSWGLSALNMQFKKKIVLSFENANFVINAKYFKNNYDNSNYYVSFMFF